MSQSKTIKAATALMGASQVINIGCRFVRNLVLARLLVPADFGIGATFAITLSFWEMISELGPRKQLVQDPEGGSPQWQANAQLLFVVRGLFIMVLLFLLAPYIAAYFDIPEATTSFRWLAVVPLIRGLIHCDVFRFQRDLQLGRLAAFQTLPTVIGVVLAPLFALWLGNYRAFLAVIFIESLLGTGLSHLVAKRTYQWGYDSAIVRRFIGFGLPLIGNGLLLFSVMHGDRFLIASYFDLPLLGAFSVVFGLALQPTLGLANLHGSVGLPLLARARQDSEQLHHYCRLSAQAMCLLAGLMATLFVTAGPWLIKTLYGDQYLQPLIVGAIPWIGLMCAVRLARTTVSTAALAYGETKIPFLSNLARAVSFLVAWGLASWEFSLATIPACGFVGEVVAYGISTYLVGRRCGIQTRVFYGPFGVVTAFVACAWLMAAWNLPIPGIAPPLVAGLWLIALTTYCAAIWPSLRGMAFAMIRTN